MVSSVFPGARCLVAAVIVCAAAVFAYGQQPRPTPPTAAQQSTASSRPPNTAGPASSGACCALLSVSGNFDPAQGGRLPGGGAWIAGASGAGLGPRLSVMETLRFGVDDIAGHPAGDFEIGGQFLFDPRAHPGQPVHARFLMPFAEIGIGDRSAAPFHAYVPVGIGAYIVSRSRLMPFVEFRELFPVAHTHWPPTAQLVIGMSWAVPD